MPSANLRPLLRQIYLDTLKRVQVSACCESSIRTEGLTLRLSDLAYRLAEYRRVLVLAVGKAALPAIQVLVQRICSTGFPRDQLHAFAVVPPGTLRGPAPEGIEVVAGSHPLPGLDSRAAAQRAMELLSAVGPRDLVLFLVSGGSSAMLELPLDRSITVAETADFYRALIHSGLPIAEMNTLRKHFSAVKGGRLAALAGSATQCTLLISDVPPGMDHAIGSGPSLPDPTTTADCRRLLEGAVFAQHIPPRIRAYLTDACLAETPKADDECFRNAQWRTILSSETMLHAASQICEAEGFHTVIDTACDEWEYGRAADYLLERLRTLSREHPRVCLLSAGELSVPVVSHPGVGGRNQQFALYCATRLREDEAFSIFSAGSDGVDGNSAAAGAIVDGTTVARALDLKLSAASALDRFDAYPFFAQIGDAIVVGPTGNNLRDLRILCHARAS